MSNAPIPLNVVRPAPVEPPVELPQTVRIARQLAGLESFLDQASLGFHWSILDNLHDGIYITDLDRRIRYWSTGAEQITGFRAADVLGRRCADQILRHVDEQGNCLCICGCPLAAVMTDGRTRSARVFLHHKDGHRVPVQVTGVAVRDWLGKIIGAFESFSDATESLAAIERIHLLENEAFRDALTGLPNRRCSDSHILSRLAELKRDGLGFGLILADVDNFKRFNDEHGHECGDEVLKVVASSLAHACRSGDFVARWGGEEFIVITAEATPPRLRSVAERLRMVVEHSWIERDGPPLHVTISCGATIARPEDDEHTLFRRVDELLYESKSAGRNHVSIAC